MAVVGKEKAGACAESSAVCTVCVCVVAAVTKEKEGMMVVVVFSCVSLLFWG
jgi:hypothetical protein